MTIQKVKIFSRYNPPPSEGLSGFEPTRTQQHFKDEVNINNIVKRAIATRDNSVFTPAQRAQYYDTTAFSDYQSALDMLSGVEDDFMSLPSSVRQQFGHNPETYVEFMSNPANLQKAIELGLLQGGEKTTATPPPSGPSSPAGAPSETPKPSVSEPPAATE
ncbi:hypothetical protein [Enterobacter ludwigii]|uniref:hypothetical protein n=1 Tax=Enterobacter ludwigii TaxID=299767 RepID=UPI001BDF8D3B|nr:hypothetical protein [Enterobacter ludwigii]MBT1846966.1 hypothetical protein [Enterobacter ludwigii]